MPNPLPSQISKFKDAVNWFLEQPDYQKPKVEVLTTIYQATNALYPSKDEYMGLADVSGGVCQGMALEWIKKNGLAGGGEDFRKLVASDWTSFAGSQLSISHAKRCIKQLQAQLDVRRDALDKDINALQADSKYQKETGFLASIKHAVSPPMTIEQRSQGIASAKKRTAELQSEQSGLMADTEAMYTNRVFDSGSPNKKFKKLSGGLSFSQIGTTIQGDQGNHPAYYMINLAGDQADSGHCVAAHAAFHPRLLDANSCEFRFESMTTFYSFLSDYWQIYERAGYASTRSSLYRFDVRVSRGPLASQTLESLNRKQVMNQLLQRFQ